MKKGLVHIYTGDGKGKTTAAMGLAIRAAGCGYEVRIFQFCKSMQTGEINSLGKLDRITFQRDGCDIKKFSWQRTPEENEIWIGAQQALFDDACEAACDPDCDVVIMDELMGAIHAGAIDVSQVKYLLTHKYKGTELVMTGRNAPTALIELADYVTEMKCIKHPYQQGIDARRGIEM